VGRQGRSIQQSMLLSQKYSIHLKIITAINLQHSKLWFGGNFSASKDNEIYQFALQMTVRTEDQPKPNRSDNARRVYLTSSSKN